MIRIKILPEKRTYNNIFLRIGYSRVLNVYICFFHTLSNAFIISPRNNYQLVDANVLRRVANPAPAGGRQTTTSHCGKTIPPRTTPLENNKGRPGLRQEFNFLFPFRGHPYTGTRFPHSPYPRHLQTRYFLSIVNLAGDHPCPHAPRRNLGNFVSTLDQEATAFLSAQREATRRGLLRKFLSTSRFLRVLL